MGSRLTELVIDNTDPWRLAALWMAVLGWQPTGHYQGAVEIAGSPGSGPSLTFVLVSEVKQGKNRLHLDVNPVGCEQEQEVERLLGLGARRVDIGQGAASRVVLADSEGNECCVLRARVD